MKCICIKDYTVTASNYLGNKQQGPIYNMVMFNNGNKYYFRYLDGIYYVAQNTKHLRDMNRYNSYIEVLTSDQFNEHFISDFIEPQADKSDNKWLIVYNELINKLAIDDPYNLISEIEREQLIKSSKMIGLPIYEGFEYNKELTLDELQLKYDRLKNVKLHLKSSKTILNAMIKKINKIKSKNN